MKEKMNKLHDRLVKCAIECENTEELLISTYYNYSLLAILNYLFKDIKPTELELDVIEYLLEEWEWKVGARDGI